MRILWTKLSVSDEGFWGDGDAMRLGFLALFLIFGGARARCWCSLSVWRWSKGKRIDCGEREEETHGFVESNVLD